MTTPKPRAKQRITDSQLKRAILAHEKWMRSHDWNNTNNKPENGTDRMLMRLACAIRAEHKRKGL